MALKRFTTDQSQKLDVDGTGYMCTLPLCDGPDVDDCNPLALRCHHLLRRQKLDLRDKITRLIRSPVTY